VKTDTSSDKLISRAQALVQHLILDKSVPEMNGFKGRGIVTCAGGYRYFTNAWIQIKLLRYLGCDLPIQLWYCGAEEMDSKMRRMVGLLDVECVNAMPHVAKEVSFNVANRGPMLKATAIAKSSFEEVLFLDADNALVQEPSFLFALPEYQKSGALFWPGIAPFDEKDPLWMVFGLSSINEPGMETGQMLINKRLNREPVVFVERLNAHANIFHNFEGSSNLFRLAWRKLGKTYAMPGFPSQMLTVPDPQGNACDAMLCQHDFSGERLFQHRMFCKWDLLGDNPWIGGAFYESRSREFLEELKGQWRGLSGSRRAGAKPILHPRGRSLLNKLWLLKLLLPAPSKQNKPSEARLKADAGMDSLPSYVKPPQEVGRINVQGGNTAKPVEARTLEVILEVQFAADGTFKKGANALTGYFWEIKEQSRRTHLILHSDRGRTISLKPINSNYWQGKEALLRTVEDVFPQLGNMSRRSIAHAAHGQIASAFNRQVHVGCSEVHSEERVGDQILATYACSALSRLGVEVIFHTPFANWFSRVVEPGLIITNEPHESCIDVNRGYAAQLRYGSSRASWYASSLHPMLKPVKPKVRKAGIVRRFPFDKYIILAPYTRCRDRNWPEAHWARLASLLRNHGHELVAFGWQEHAATLQRTFSQTQLFWVVGDLSPDWVMDALLGAEAYVGVDCDMTHLAALLDVKSVVVHSQLPASFLWHGGKNIRSVTPDTSCTFCRWQEDRGYLKSCDAACSALATVNPEAVALEVLSLLGKRGDSHQRF
jgi:hypothetical protein